MAPVVVTDATSVTPAMDGIFTGLAFFLVQRLPMRSSYVDKIQANGGRVVKLEAQADHIVADHLRHDAPRGSISYTFIDAAIRHGSLPDPEEHIAGPTRGTIRDVGSVVPGKSTRTPFTKEDDQELWRWVEKARREGGQVKGNDIYKQLEARNPRHTFQAWRDRYIKKLMDRPPEGVVTNVSEDDGAQNGYVRPNAGGRKRKVEISAEAQRAGFKLPEASQNPSPKKRKLQDEESEVEADGHDQEHAPEGVNVNDNVFGKEEFDALMENAADIAVVDPEQAELAWQAWAQAMKDILSSAHSAEAWQAYWEAEVKPEYQRIEKERRRQERRARRSAVSLRAEDTAEDSGEGAGTKKPRSSSSRNFLSEQGTQISERRTATAAPVAATGDKSLAADVHEATASAPEVLEEAQPAVAQKDSQSTGFKHGISTQPIEILSDDDEEMEEQGGPAQPSDFLTSEANGKAEQQLRQEDSETPRRSDLPTSDANRAAERQLQRSMTDTSRRSDFPTSEMNREVKAQPRRRLLDGARRSDIPTSDANRAAERQLQQDANEADNEDEITPEDAADEYNDEPTKDGIVISTHLVEDGSVEDGLSGGELIDLSVSAQGDPPGLEPVEREDSGDRLTEANLASQQAEHRAQLMRGMDLPPDDENMDQSTYADYLQEIVGQKPSASSLDAVMMSQTVKGAADLTQDDPAKDQSSFAAALQDLTPTKRPMGPNGVTKEAPSQPNGTLLSGPTELELTNDLPLSSQQEIDDIFEDNLQWPASPQQRKVQKVKPQSQDESQSLHFETQIQRSKPLREIEDQDDAEMFTTQPQVSQAVQYPPLPQVNDGEVRIELENHSQSDGSALDQLQSQIENEVDMNGDEATVHGFLNGVDQNRDIDLTLAEPDGGFSSPAKDDQRDGQLQAAEQEIDLALAEPDGGFSSPVKDDRIEDDKGDKEQSEKGQGTPEGAQQKIVQISSAESSSPPRAESQLASSPPPQHRLNGRRALETQDIVEAETQQVDLSMLLPPDTDDEDDDAPRDDKEEDEEILPWSSSYVASSPRERQQTRPTPAQTAPRPSLTPPARRPIVSSKGKEKAQPQVIESQNSEDDIDSWIARMGVRYKIPASNENLIEDALYATSTRPDLAEVALLSMLAGNGLPSDLPGVWTAEEDRGCEGGDARIIRRLCDKHGEEEYYARLEWLKGWREA